MTDATLGLCVSALMVGLVSATHCVFMCGGLASAMGGAVAELPIAKRIQLNVMPHLGRLSSYAFLGAIVGQFGGVLSHALGEWGSRLLMVISSVLLVAMAGYVSGVWQGLRTLERIMGNGLRWLSPIRQRLLPIQSVWQGFALGALWGWVPCGLVYSATGLAMTAANPLTSALVMLSFGVGTLPATLSATVFSGWTKSVLTNVWLRRFAACVLLAMAVAMWFLMPAHDGHHHLHHH